MRSVPAPAPGPPGRPENSPPSAPLRGCTVGVTADRRGADQEVMLRRLGAEVLRAPMMLTVAVADEAGLRELTAALIAAPPDYLVANTGMGMSSWFQLAESWGMKEELVSALAKSVLLARGPKAAGALSSAGLKAAWRSPTEQLAEVATLLLAEPLAGKRVALQLHGDDREALSPALRAAGAEVIAVPVYQWRVPDGPAAGQAAHLIEACCDRRVDAVTFTAGPQVRNMIALAEAAGRAEPLLDAFNRGKPIAACIGPVCAGVAVEEGIREPLVPQAWRLGSLIKLIAETLGNHKGRDGRY